MLFRSGGGINEGNGIYKSTDAGKTWQHLGLDETKQIPSIVVDPHNPDIVMVAAQGNVHEQSENRGLYRSTDGGKTWSDRLPTPGNWETSLETPTLYRTIDSSGKKRVLLFSGLYPIRMAVSENDGMDWSELKPIGEYGGIVAMGSLARMKNGDYAAWFHDDGRYYRQGGKVSKEFTLYQTLSHDGGLTWDFQNLDAPPAFGPEFVKAEDGSTLVYFNTMEPGAAPRQAASHPSAPIPETAPDVKAPAPIEIDLATIDADGLRGPADGKVAVDYEFTIVDSP